MFKNIFPWWHDNKRSFHQKNTTASGQQLLQPSEELLPYQALHRDINQAFTNFWRTFEQESGHNRWSDTWNPLANLDVKETDKNLEISMDLPGFDENNIQLSIVNRLLTVKAERKKEAESKEKDYFLQERHYGQLQRSLALPENVDSDNVKAEYKNGVLKISIPQKHIPIPEVKKIPISR